MTLRKTLLAATMLALPLAAQAQPVSGLYVAGGAGVNWHGNVTADISSAFGAPPGFFSQRIESSLGWVALGSVGWGFGNGLRLEVEGNYRTNDVNHATTTVLGIRSFGTGRNGYISTMGVMANVFYDFNLGGVMPYVGAGVGYAWHRYDNVGQNIGGLLTGLRGTDGQFAYQGIVGLAVPVRAVPGLAITAEYRYFATADATMNVFNAVPGGISLNAGTSTVSNHNHSILVGARYNFGRGPAPVAVAVAPAAARSFIVFFDFDRADLTARAREIIAQAAGAARSQAVTRIEVAGHADRSGTPQYNQGLSQRRANNVAAELVRLGVARGAISVAAFGESRPLVPTADGVREPQNRRVEIVLR